MKTVNDLQARMMSFLEAANAFQPGAIIIDWFDREIFDDVLRKFILFNRIDKRKAPGETTGGFTESAIGNARVAPVRNLGFTATSPTRAERTRRSLKAIVKDISFGAFDMSVGPQQAGILNNSWGDLKEKDVADQKNASLRLWSTLAYVGDEGNDANEFDGMQQLLGAGTVVGTSASIVKAINTACAEMIDNQNSLVMPTAIYANAYADFMIGQELLKLGPNVGIPQTTIFVGDNPMQVTALKTPAGVLPVINDPFNRPSSATPAVYDVYIMSEDKLSWQYAEVFQQPGADPKTFEIQLTNALDRHYKTVMFGALELLGGTTHHRRLSVDKRTTAVSPE